MDLRKKTWVKAEIKEQGYESESEGIGQNISRATIRKYAAELQREGQGQSARIKGKNAFITDGNREKIIKDLWRSPTIKKLLRELGQPVDDEKIDEMINKWYPKFSQAKSNNPEELIRELLMIYLAEKNP